MTALALISLVLAVSCLVHYDWSVRREIQKSREWLKAFQVEDARQQREFRRRLRRGLRSNGKCG